MKPSQEVHLYVYYQYRDKRYRKGLYDGVYKSFCGKGWKRCATVFTASRPWGRLTQYKDQVTCEECIDKEFWNGINSTSLEGE